MVRPAGWFIERQLEAHVGEEFSTCLFNLRGIKRTRKIADETHWDEVEDLPQVGGC